MANGAAAGFTPVVNMERELQVNFPIGTLTDFQEFDERLKDKDVEALMVTYTHAYMYTYHVGGKKNFSTTKCFTCLHSEFVA